MSSITSLFVFLFSCLFFFFLDSLYCTHSIYKIVYQVVLLQV